VVDELRDPTTIEEIAALTDAEAVRRRFDVFNAKLIAWLSVVFVIVGGATALVYTFQDVGAWKRTFAVANFVVACCMLFVFGDLHLAQRGGRAPRRIVQRIARSLGDWVVALFALHFATIVMISPRSDEHAMAWAMTYTWIVVLMRLSVRRRLTLHVLMLAVVIVAVEIAATRRLGRQVYVSAGIASAVIFLIGTVNSRRVRREVIEFWAGRREQAREQLRMRSELQLAREVQLSMLPEAPPAIPWLDIAASSVPATEVGGDYYDYFPVGTRLAVVCGDVAGHGLASGIVLATLRSGFTLLRESLSDPAGVLERLHDLVSQTTRRRMLATAAVVLLDPETRRASVASAGHPPVIVASNGNARSIELFAPPLGVRLPVRIAQTDFAFGSGDYFVLHSDGIYESRNEHGDTYGMDRLERVVATHRDASAAALRDAILRDVEQFRGRAPQDDDATVVVLRVV
jgi:hypothetical protein